MFSQNVGLTGREILDRQDHNKKVIKITGIHIVVVRKKNEMALTTRGKLQGQWSGKQFIQK